MRGAGAVLSAIGRWPCTQRLAPLIIRSLASRDGGAQPVTVGRGGKLKGESCRAVVAEVGIVDAPIR